MTPEPVRRGVFPAVAGSPKRQVDLSAIPRGQVLFGCPRSTHRRFPIHAGQTCPQHVADRFRTAVPRPVPARASLIEKRACSGGHVGSRTGSRTNTDHTTKEGNLMSDGMTQLDALLMSIAGAPALPGARCRGRHHLFDCRGEHEGDATVAARHRQARGLCERCPSLEACRAWVGGLHARKRPPSVVAGTGGVHDA